MHSEGGGARTRAHHRSCGWKRYAPPPAKLYAVVVVEHVVAEEKSGHSRTIALARGIQRNRDKDRDREGDNGETQANSHHLSYPGEPNRTPRWTGRVSRRHHRRYPSPPHPPGRGHHIAARIQQDREPRERGGGGSKPIARFRFSSPSIASNRIESTYGVANASPSCGSSTFHSYIPPRVSYCYSYCRLCLCGSWQIYRLHAPHAAANHSHVTSPSSSSPTPPLVTPQQKDAAYAQHWRVVCTHWLEQWKGWISYGI